MIEINTLRGEFYILGALIANESSLEAVLDGKVNYILILYKNLNPYNLH